MISVTFILSGCEQEGSVKWYMSHQEEMFNKYSKCISLNDKKSDDCINVIKAVNEAGKHDPDVKEKAFRLQQLNAPVPDLNNLG